MLREKNRVIVQFHLFLDVLITATAFVGAYFIKKHLLPATIGGLSTGPNYYYLLSMVVVIWGLSFQAFKLYASYRKRSLMQILFNAFQAVCFSLLMFATLLYILKIQDVSRGMMLLFGLLNVGMLFFSKTAVYVSLGYMRERGFNTRNILMVGSRECAKDILKKIKMQKGVGYKVQGCLEIDPSRAGMKIAEGVNVIGMIGNLEQILKETIVDELIFAMPLQLIPNASRHLALAEEMGVSVRIIPDWQMHNLVYKPGTVTVGFESFLQIPSMKIHSITPNDVGLMFKHVFDYLFSCLLLLCSLPFFLLVGLAIKAFSPGPVFYTQKRTGINGRTFDIYKFRTMVVGADKMLDELKARNEADGPVFKIRKDPRVIPYVGTFLRKTSMDELPQLINVVMGEMSLIGPRPPIPSEVSEYKLWQRRRLSMKPGMTCIWQVTPNRNDVSFDGWMKMDLEYIDNWSLGMDAKILLSTIRTVMMGSGR